VTLKHAHAVAERAIGVPTEMQSRLGRVSAELASSGILVPEDRKLLEERLSVTLRSLDLRPERPNAVLLLVGEAASWGHALAETLAVGIAGSAERVIAIDLSTFDEAWDIRHLVGSSDGKPAREAHALSRLVDAPWSVVLLANVDGCHQHVRATITRALEQGYITDVTGRKIHLSDTIVVFTAPTIARVGRGPVGFIEPENGATGVNSVSQILGKEMAGMLDLVVDEVDVESPPAKATRKRLFEDLARRYRTRGLRMTWDQSVVDWLSADSQQRRTQEEWDRWVDHELAAALIPHLPAKPSDAMRSVVVRQTPSGLVVEATKKAEAAKRAGAR
jgi:ATP-dependent Clp protease ATP-binding subunit ClpA